MIEISVDELEANLNEYLQQVEKGEILVIARRGNVLARIVPAGKSG